MTEAAPSVISPLNTAEPISDCNSFIAPLTCCEEVVSEPTVTLPVTPNVPATVVLPEDATTLNLLVLISKLPVKANVLRKVAPFKTSSVESISTAPSTFNVPAINVLPVPFATVNLFVSMVRPPFNCVAPVTVKLANVAKSPTLSVPSITPNPSTFKFLSTSKSLSIVRSLLNVASVLLPVKNT